MRQLLRRTLLTAAVVASGISLAAAQGLVTKATAARYGLTRAWYAQVGSKGATGTLEYVNYDEGMLLAHSSRGMLTALDAETGRTLWATQVGPRGRSSTEPAANDKFVVVISGSTLYAVRRDNGEIAWQRQIRGAPGAGPGVTKTHAFVPIVNGLVEGYDLEKGINQTPWNYKSAGHVLTPPMTTELTVSWTTDRGYFFVADPSGGGVRYRMETRGAIHARPAAWSPLVFACSIDGYVYAVNEQLGSVAWEFPTGDAVYEPPVAIESRVFVVCEFDGMYCLDSATGNPLWHVPNVKQFVATSPSRVYVVDRTDRLAILDAAGGARLATIPHVEAKMKLVNGRSDRIFLVSDACVIQCLHETQLRTPLVYTPPPLPKEPELEFKPRERKPTEPADFGDEPAADEPPTDEPMTDEPMTEKPPGEKPPAEDDSFDKPTSDESPPKADNPFNP